MKRRLMNLCRYQALTAALCALMVLVGCFPAPAAAEQAAYDPDHPENLLPTHLSCSSAILIEAESGEVIFEKNADARIYPASTTKILTTYLGILFDNPDRKVTVSASAMDIPEDSSTIPLSFGEEVVFRDVLYATMLRSGNEGANVIADTVSGSVPAFVWLMNNAAESFGCTGTHFVNPHGYHDEGHYSTTRDMATLAQIAMKNETFRDIVRKTVYDMPEDNIYNARALRGQNYFLSQSSNANLAAAFYPYGIGIKTGHTNAAGWCYVGAAEYNGVTLISCVYHSRSELERFTDTIKLMEYGFTQFKGVSISELYTLNPRIVDIAHYALSDSNLGKLTLALHKVESEGSDQIITSMGNIDYLSHHLNDITITEYTRAFSAPVQEGEVMGTLTYYDSDGRPTVYELLATRSIQRREKLAPSIEDIIAYTEGDPNPFPRFSFEFVFIYLVLPLIVILMIIRFFRRLKHRKTRKKKHIQNIEPQERYFR